MTKATMKNKPRLGRGLSSLMALSGGPIEKEIEAALPAATVPVQPAPTKQLLGKPLEIPLDDIRPNPHQPRKHIDPASIAELASSIRSNGVIQPIVVRKVADGYELIAGERRWRASRQAGLFTVPAIVRETDGFTQAQMALVENIQREDLNPIDRATGYRTLMDQLGLTQTELATRLGEDRSSIANFVRLLDLGATARELLRTGALSVGHAKLLAGVPDVLEQDRLANLVVAQGLSVRNLERLLAGHAAPAATRRPAASPAHLQELEKSIGRQLGLRVQMRSTGTKGRGRMVIHYGSLDQFDSLISRLGVETE